MADQPISERMAEDFAQVKQLADLAETKIRYGNSASALEQLQQIEEIAESWG